MELKPHDLVKIKNLNALINHGERPSWVNDALMEAPWVVVRRSSWYDGMIPIGVRGKTRSERFAAFLPMDAVATYVTPEQISKERVWSTSTRGEEINAIRVLEEVNNLMIKQGCTWGPAGSVGFELISGISAARESSDLDIVIRADEPIEVKKAKATVEALSKLPVQIDVQLDTGVGAVSLAEYARGVNPVLLKTMTGPLLVTNPWCRDVAVGGIT
ncbi:malonate decarboxylase holo-ACP synthase [Bacillus sp. FJAT-45350]|uniref:malonate decarboxylase holo-ACP synthase n=1 Tax=Bacillus sp. FJAT-45350 TaxID=2011014 RepID=UPI000BB735C8|nr:malonate decarboxylase holo-ACP synthase [Bacillus sp. FJAT-45350]